MTRGDRKLLRADGELEDPEDPCLPDADLEFILAHLGQACPRVELDDENMIAASIASMALSAEIPLVSRRLLELSLDELAPERRKTILMRISSAVTSAEVSEALSQAREAARDAAIAKAKAKAKKR